MASCRCMLHNSSQLECSENASGCCRHVPAPCVLSQRACQSSLGADHCELLQVKELAEVLREASAEFPQLAEHASFLDE